MIEAIIEAIHTLLGMSHQSDIAQDFYGFRALVLRLDPYPPLVEGFRAIGIDWPITHASTHPPTAYLLTAPVAFLPWPVASAVWGWLMVAALAASLRLNGLRWRWVIALTAACLFWPPFAFSLGQLTPLWMLGLALAYRNREKPATAGAWIAFASLTKFFPALLLVPFLLRRKWSAVAGFAAVWLLALALVFALHPGAIPRYIEVNTGNSPDMIARTDNAAMLPFLLRWFGMPGVLIGACLLAVVAWRGREDWHTWEFLAVALLPIAWVYSLLPLLPGMVARIRGGWKQGLLPAFTVALLLIFPSFGPFSPFAIVPSIILFAPLSGLRIRPDVVFRFRSPVAHPIKGAYRSDV